MVILPKKASPPVARRPSPEPDEQGDARGTTLLFVLVRIKHLREGRIWMSQGQALLRLKGDKERKSTIAVSVGAGFLCGFNLDPIASFTTYPDHLRIAELAHSVSYPASR